MTETGKSKRCYKCICPKCELFNASGCLLGENGCERCEDDNLVIGCGYYKGALKGVTA